MCFSNAYLEHSLITKLITENITIITPEQRYNIMKKLTA